MKSRGPRLKAPFPYFGGKSIAAAAVWAALGDPPNYVEPFAGSAAVLLARPNAGDGKIETINDADGFVANFWRAISHDADQVAKHADWPVNECVPAGTRIATPSGSVAVEDVRPGMTVLGERDGRAVPTTVGATRRGLATEFIRLGALTLTPNHPVRTEAGYVISEALEVGTDVAVLLGGERGWPSLGRVRITRSANERGAVRRRYLSSPPTGGAFVEGAQGRSDAPLLLDSWPSTRWSNPAMDTADERARERLANRGACDDHIHAREGRAVGEPDRRRGRNAGQNPDAGRAAGSLATHEGQEVPGVAARRDEWVAPLTGGAPSNRGERGGAATHNGDAGGHRGGGSWPGHVQGCGGIRDAQTRHPADPGTQGQDRGNYIQSEGGRLRGDKEGVPVDHGGGARPWSYGSVGVSGDQEGMSLQRSSLSSPVEVFNFQTETGNYFANDILVHNCDLVARHSWLVRHATDMLDRLHADPEYYDCKTAGWWCWGKCAWIGGGWCSGKGPWMHDGENIVDRRKQPHLADAGRGIQRRRPQLGSVWGSGMGINRRPPRQLSRSDFIREWFAALMDRTREVRVTVGDWQRVLTHCVTTLHGVTGVFLDPPYTTRAKDMYSVGDEGGALAADARDWCAANGNDERLRIVLCGHAGEHDALLAHGWSLRTWTSGCGYARSAEALARARSETLSCSPHCVPERAMQERLL